MQSFVYFSFVFSLYIMLYNCSSTSSDILVSQTSGGISLSLAAFLLLIF